MEDVNLSVMCDLCLKIQGFLGKKTQTPKL